MSLLVRSTPPALRIACPPRGPLSRGQHIVATLHQLLYPRFCPVCGDRLPAAYPPVCLACRSKLGRYHELDLHALDRLLGASLPPVRLYSLYLYTHGSAVQRIVYSIKYEGNRALARHMGQVMGMELRLRESFADVLVPVPIPSIRALQRGFNQSALLAEGISSVTGIPYAPEALRRVRFSGSQTHRGRLGRLISTLGEFASTGAPIPPGSHIMVIDDVLTTGGTLSAVIDALMSYQPRHISVATLAVSTMD